VKTGDKDDRHFQDEFLQPSKVAIADDDNTYQLFGDHIFCAPKAEREAAEEAMAETEASPNESASEMEIPTRGTQPKIPPPDTAIPQANTGPEQTLKSSHGPGHRPSNRPDAAPQPTPPAKSKDPPVPPSELSPTPGSPSITPLIDIGMSL
jgi:hypothetical protein